MSQNICRSERYVCSKLVKCILTLHYIIINHCQPILLIAILYRGNIYWWFKVKTI